MIEIWQTINKAVAAALDDGLDSLSAHELMQRADYALETIPSVTGTGPTAALLLRRYQSALQHEICLGREPRPLPDDLDGEVRELTRAVMVVLGIHEGISIEISVLLALAIRANGLQQFCALPSPGKPAARQDCWPPGADRRATAHVGSTRTAEFGCLARSIRLPGRPLGV